MSLKTFKSKLTQSQQFLDKTDPSYVTIRRVDQACREQNLPGYKGILIDHLKVSESRFDAVVDIAGKSKLFSIITDDMITA